jgi:branched-subunit amino acid transport protein
MTAVQLLAIGLAGVLTYAIRASFLVVAGRMTGLPPVVTTVLRMIPAAALAALVLPGLLRPDAGGFDPLNSVALGGLAAVIVARWKRNIGLSLAVGLVVVVALQPVLG